MRGSWLGVVVCGVAVLAAAAGPSAVGSAAGTCTAAQQAARARALKVFEAGTAAGRSAFFRTHRNAAARRAFLRAQRARERTLKTAAACLVVEVPPPAAVAATIPLDGANRMTSAAGSLWVNAGGPSGHVVARIDPATNAVLATIALPFPSTIAGDIGYGFGSIWESDLDTQTVTRIDPATDKVVATIPAQGTGTNGLAFTGSNVWVANHNEPAAVNGANVAKIDPATNQVVATVPIGTGQGGPAWLIEAAGSIWAFDQSQEKIDRIDPGTGSIKTISSPVGRSANRHFATDGTRVWFSVPLDTGPPLVQMIDPATNTISTTVSATTLARYGVNTVYGLDFDSGSLWLSGPCGSQACVLRVDASTNAVTGAWSFPGSGDDDALELQLAAGSVWVSEHQAVLRLGIP